MSGSVLSSKPVGNVFQSAATPRKPDKRKRTPPVSIRFTNEERDLLQASAGNQSLSTYVRHFVLKAHGAKTKRAKTPSIDRQEVARTLSVLGRSELVPLLREALSAAENGTLALDWRTEADLRLACAELSALRSDLMGALGLRGSS